MFRKYIRMEGSVIADPPCLGPRTPSLSRAPWTTALPTSAPLFQKKSKADSSKFDSAKNKYVPAIKAKAN